MDQGKQRGDGYDPNADSGEGVERVLDPSQIGGDEGMGPEVIEPMARTLGPGGTRLGLAPEEMARLGPRGTRLGPPPAMSALPGSALVADPYIGQTIAGRYTVARLIARGGFGAVYLATDVRLAKMPCAIKIMDFSRENREVAAAMLRRVIDQEIVLQARIRHPNLLPITDWGRVYKEKEAFTAYLVTPLVPDSMTLNALVRAHNGPLPWEVVTNLYGQICAALSAMHTAGCIHRDMKPDNVMVVDLVPGYPHGFVQVIDFGSAKRSENFTTADGTTMAEVGTKRDRITQLKHGVPVTPVYAAPEWADIAGYTPAFDVFALGGVLYFMVTGQDMSDTENHEAFLAALRRGQVPRMRDLRSDVPEALDEFVFGHMLADSPSDRPTDARAAFEGVVGLLTALAAPRPAPTRRPTPMMRPPGGVTNASRTPSRPMREREERRRALGIAMTLAAIAVGLVVITLIGRTGCGN